VEDEILRSLLTLATTMGLVIARPRYAGALLIGWDTEFQPSATAAWFHTRLEQALSRPVDIVEEGMFRVYGSHIALLGVARASLVERLKRSMEPFHAVCCAEHNLSTQITYSDRVGFLNDFAFDDEMTRLAANLRLYASRVLEQAKSKQGRYGQVVRAIDVRGTHAWPDIWVRRHPDFDDRVLVAVGDTAWVPITLDAMGLTREDDQPNRAGRFFFAVLDGDGTYRPQDIDEKFDVYRAWRRELEDALPRALCADGSPFTTGSREHGFKAAFKVGLRPHERPAI
jgi:hypothetical protein